MYLSNVSCMQYKLFISLGDTWQLRINVKLENG